MRDMVSRSPITQHLSPVHVIPFGIEVNSFLRDEEKAESRRQLGIPADDFVVLFRSTPSSFKGLQYIIEAFGQEPPVCATTLLTVDKRDLVNDLKQAYNVVELGWVGDPDRYARAYSACDVLLMPSTAEAFGLMALEAMAAGRPVVCFEGTSLPSVTFAPECGVAVPPGDVGALRAALDRLAQNPAEAARRGALGRSLSAQHYRHEQYLDGIVEVYTSALGNSGTT